MKTLGRLEPPQLAAAPSSPALGEMYFDSATNTLFWWNGTVWVTSGGVPKGGSSGCVLMKQSGADYDVDWDPAPSGLPAGGSTDQVLAKNSPTDFDVKWATPAAGGGGGAGSATDIAPIGVVIAWSGTTIPTDYLLCNGQQVGEGAYPALAAFAATEIASGNSLWGISGTSPTRTITLPDLRDRFIYGGGAGKVNGTKSGAETHTLTTTQAAQKAVTSGAADRS